MTYEMPAQTSAYMTSINQQLPQHPFIHHDNGAAFAPPPSDTTHHNHEAFNSYNVGSSTLPNDTNAHLDHHYHSGYEAPAPLVWGPDGRLGQAPLKERTDNASLLGPEIVNKAEDATLEKLEHDYVRHTQENENLINSLSEQERTIVRLDGGNTVESQLMVYKIITQYPVDADDMRVWRKVVIITPSGRRKVEYHCNGVDDKGVSCEHSYSTLQKSRQHFVSSHVEEPCWTCPIAGCPDPRKYKRLDDLKHHHMVPFHRVYYTRSKARVTAQPPKCTPTNPTGSPSNYPRESDPPYGGAPALSVAPIALSPHAAGPLRSRSRLNPPPVGTHPTSPLNARPAPPVIGSNPLTRQGGRSISIGPMFSQPLGHDTTSSGPVQQFESYNPTLSAQTEPYHRSPWSGGSSPYVNSPAVGRSPFVHLEHPATLSPPPTSPFNVASANLTRSPGYGKAQNVDPALSPAGYGRTSRLDMLAQRSATQSPTFSELRRLSSVHGAPHAFSYQQVQSTQAQSGRDDGGGVTFEEYFNRQIDQMPNNPTAGAQPNLSSIPATQPSNLSGHRSLLRHEPGPYTTPGYLQSYFDAPSAPLNTSAPDASHGQRLLQPFSVPSSHGLNGRSSSTSVQLTYRQTQPPSNLPPNGVGSHDYHARPTPLASQEPRACEEHSLGIFDAYDLDPNLPPFTSFYYGS